jgi:hypothetical protein
MNENLDRDPFADDAKRRPSRLRRTAVRTARRSQRAACAAAAAAPFAADRQPITTTRDTRPCPHAARGPLRRPGA